MILKLYNGVVTNESRIAAELGVCPAQVTAAVRLLELNVTGGGYDPELGRVVLIVQSDHGQAGTLHLDPSEAARVAGLISTNLPKIERIEVPAGALPPEVPDGRGGVSVQGVQVPTPAVRR